MVSVALPRVGGPVAALAGALRRLQGGFTCNPGIAPHRSVDVPAQASRSHVGPRSCSDAAVEARGVWSATSCWKHSHVCTCNDRRIRTSMRMPSHAHRHAFAAPQATDYHHVRSA